MYGRSRSRSPVRSKNLSKQNDIVRRRNDNVMDCRVLYIKPIPKFWNAEKVKSFIQDKCKSRTIPENIKFVLLFIEDNGDPSCLVKFANSYICNLALMELENVEIDGKRLFINLDTDNLFNKKRNMNRNIFKHSKQRTQSSQKTQDYQNPVQQAEQSHESQPQMNANTATEQTSDAQSSKHETYGLSLNFLESLNIKLPLLNKIFIGNLDVLVTESKLREVFGYCGQIVSCSIIVKDDKLSRYMAKIEYDHPVEAVQAIAMLNRQELYNKRMLVQMDTAPRPFPNNLPNGLGGFGPGLGVDGEPLRGVRVHLEMRPIKQLLENLKEDIQKQNQVNDLNKYKEMQNANSGFEAIVQPQVAPVLNQAQIPVMVQPFANQTFVAVPQMKTSAAQMQAATEYGLAMMNAQQVSRWDQTSAQWNVIQTKQFEDTSALDGNYSRQAVDDKRDSRAAPSAQSVHAFESDNTKQSTSMVVFSYLPPSVDLQALSNKMREVGEVKFVDVLGMGRAIVSFFNVRDAERCVKFFDGSKVDGQTIEVKYF